MTFKPLHIKCHKIKTLWPRPIISTLDTMIELIEDCMSIIASLACEVAFKTRTKSCP